MVLHRTGGGQVRLVDCGYARRPLDRQRQAGRFPLHLLGGLAIRHSGMGAQGGRQRQLLQYEQRRVARWQALGTGFRRPHFPREARSFPGCCRGAVRWQPRGGFHRRWFVRDLGRGTHVARFAPALLGGHHPPAHRSVQEELQTHAAGCQRRPFEPGPRAGGDPVCPPDGLDSAR